MSLTPIQPPGSYIGIDDICNSWLTSHEKHDNSYWKVIKYAADAVRELSLTSLPLLQHKILTRPAGQNWFDLPDDFTAEVSMGIRFGDSWLPVGMSQQLLGMPAFLGNGDLDVDDFNPNDLNTQGDQTNWGSQDQTQPSFNPANFSGSNFLAATVPSGASNTVAWLDTWLCNHWDLLETVVLTPSQILTGKYFYGDELYLVYVGIGSVDSMTHIPIAAQATIEAYIDWKWMQNRRNGLREAAGYRQLYNREHKILRARLNPLSIIDIKHAMTIYKRYRYLGANGVLSGGVGGYAGYGGFGGGLYGGLGGGITNTVQTPVFINGSLVYTASAGDTAISDIRLSNKTVTLITGSGWSKPFGDGFTQPDANGFITFTDGTVLPAGNITIFFY